MTKLVAFDLDGTLNMTHTYAVAAYQEALKELGAGPVAESVIRSRFGAPFRDDSLFFLGDDSEEAFRRFYRAVERHWAPLMRERAQTYPGVPEMLGELKEQGYVLAVCSNAKEEELEDVLPEYKIAAGVYAPNDEIYGKFHVLLPVNEKTKRTLFELKQIYSGRWDVNERTKERIPSLPEDYLVSKEAEEILQMVDKTPARLFMMTGDAGTGKTTDARMIAQILGLPYYVFTCGPGTDELELLATTVPNMGGTAHLEMELPRLEDIEMDPASALATVNGIYEEGISREKAFQEILKAVYEKGYEKSKNEKDFLLKESEIVKACREPSVIEIQEPAMIEKPGTLTRLNSLFDDGAVTDLVNGEQIRRNPDTIVIMTTNLDYVGCQNFNQSVLSRMNLIQPKEALTEEEMAKRAMKRTGFKNKELLSFMAATVCKIHEYLIEQDITDGVCGYRELENWVLSYMVSNDLRRSAWTALLSKASMDREEQGTMERVFLLPHCDVD